MLVRGRGPWRVPRGPVGPGPQPWVGGREPRASAHTHRHSTFASFSHTPVPLPSCMCLPRPSCFSIWPFCTLPVNVNPPRQTAPTSAPPTRPHEHAVMRPVKEHRLRREVKILQHVSGGPNIVRLLDIVRDPDTKTPSFVFDFVDAMPFKELQVRREGLEGQWTLARQVDFGGLPVMEWECLEGGDRGCQCRGYDGRRRGARHRWGGVDLSHWLYLWQGTRRGIVQHQALN